MSDETNASTRATVSSDPEQTPVLPWVWLGRIHHDLTTSLQEQIRAVVIGTGDPGALLVCEHPPVVTLGRRARPDHLLVRPAEFARRGIDLRAVSRGGEVTYHGPGQLVAYPVLRLRHGVLAHVEGMAAAVVEFLRSFGVTGQWRRERPGVWVGDAKICAFGIHVRRAVAIHGLALNLTVSPDHFATIIPCGQTTASVTSLHDQLLRTAVQRVDASALTPEALAPALVAQLGRHLRLRFEQEPADAPAQFRIAKLIATVKMNQA